MGALLGLFSFFNLLPPVRIILDGAFSTFVFPSPDGRRKQPVSSCHICLMQNDELEQVKCLQVQRGRLLFVLEVCFPLCVCQAVDGIARWIKLQSC